ncbi:unnamed protein product, partial [Linum tenue]
MRHNDDYDHDDKEESRSQYGYGSGEEGYGRKKYGHFKELLLEHAPPPPALAEFAIANLIKMGIPQRAAEGSIAICSCH